MFGSSVGGYKKRKDVAMQNDYNEMSEINKEGDL
jgi:hypothetical protein